MSLLTITLSSEKIRNFLPETEEPIRFQWSVVCCLLFVLKPEPPLALRSIQLHFLFNFLLTSVIDHGDPISRALVLQNTCQIYH